MILVLAAPVLMALRDVFAPISTIAILSFIAVVLFSPRVRRRIQA